MGIAPFVPGLSKVVAVFVGGLIVEGSMFSADREKTRQSEAIDQQAAEIDQQDAEFELRNLLDAAISLLEAHHPHNTATFRANVMVVKSDELHIVLATAGYLDEEIELVWRSGEGAAGCAWFTGQVQVAPMVGYPLPTLQEAHAVSRPWGMTKDQILQTAEQVKWVISVPLRSERDNFQRVIGVLNVDDSEPPSDGPEKQRIVDVVAQTLGDDVEKLLPQTGLNS